MTGVVITGLGALTRIYNELKGFGNRLVSGKSGAAPITRLDASTFRFFIDQ
jgi:3-oxoacyl-[acyl-carrier-protein] synthase II